MRYLIAALGVLLVIGGLAAIKGCQITKLMAFGKEAKAQGTPPEAVGTAKAVKQSWEATLDAVGSVASVKGVAVSNEVPGVVTRIAFESGATVRRGDILVELDSSVERAELASARAQQELATTNFARTRPLVDKQAATREELDQAESELKARRASVASLEAQLRKRVVRAPFDGRLGIREVNLGQYLNPGTPITVLEATDAALVDFTLPQQRLSDVLVGMPVRVDVGGADLSLGGAIAAVEPAVDITTRAIRLRARMDDGNGKLRPGMFVDVAVVLPRKQSFVTVPATAIVHASYGDSVFIVEDKKPDEPGARQTPDGKRIKVARQQFVRVGQRRGDFVAIVEGLEAGREVVSAGAFKLRNGSPIFVSDAPVPRPELAPHPENR